MPSNEQETFLVVLHTGGDQCQCFLWQGTYEDVYKLKHDIWEISIFLLMPEEPQMWTGFGTQLLRVCDIRSTYKFTQLIDRALFELSRLAPQQATLELEGVLAKLRSEKVSYTQQSYAATKQGDLQRLADLGIEPLGEDELERLRR